MQFGLANCVKVYSFIYSTNIYQASTGARSYVRCWEHSSEENRQGPYSENILMRLQKKGFCQYKLNKSGLNISCLTSLIQTLIILGILHYHSN